MKQKTIIQFMFLLVALLVGNVNAWGQAASIAPEDGKSYVVAAYVNSKYYALPNTTTNGGTLTGVEISLNAANKVSTTDASGKTWTLEEGTGDNANYYYFKYTSGNDTYYLYKNGTSNKNHNFKVSTGDKNYWSFTTNGTGYTVAAVDRGTNHINIHCNSGTYSCDNTATVIRLLEIGDVTTHMLNFSATNGTIAVTNGGTPVTSGSQVAESALLNVSATANTGYSFSTWTTNAGSFGDATNSSTTFTMPTSDATIGATFTLNTHTLSVSGANGTYNTMVNGVAWDGTSEIPYGSTVSITAVPDANYSFKAWSSTLDSYSATDNPLVFTMPDEDVEVEATNVNADTEYNITIDGNISNGDVTSNKAKAKAGVTVELTATPNSGYAHTTWTVVDDESNVITVTNNQFIMPANNVTISATFTKIHTIVYAIGDEIDETTRLDGETLNIPVSASGFAGWTDDNGNVTPSISNDDIVTDDMEIYAVFVSGFGAPTYNKVTSTAEVTAGKYLIVYESDKIVFDGSLETLDKGGNTRSVSSAYTTGVITASGAIDAMNFTLAVYDGGFSIKSASGKYIGRSASSNGMDTDDSDLKNTITISNGNALIVGTGGYHLRFNSASGASNYRFRYYGSSSQQSIQLYKRTENPTYSLNAYDEVNISAAGYATFSSTEKLDFTNVEGLTAYKATTTGETSVTLEDVTGIVPAETGLLLKGDEATYYIPVSTADPTANVTGNLLQSTATAEYEVTGLESGTAYVFGKLVDEVGFFKAATGKTIGVGKSWLLVPGTGAKDVEFLSFVFGDEESETTAIKAVVNEQAREGVYDLQGRKVTNPTKGLYIVNGKKVIIK